MTKFEEEVDKVAKQVGYESLSLLCGDCEEANKIYIHFKNWHSDEEFQTKENELKRLRKLNHLYKKAKDNAERMAANSGEDLNQAQDEISALKKQLVAREKQVMKLKEVDKAQGKEIVQIKSQLQQQALPVVPECVGNFLSGKSIFKIANGDIPDDVISWVQEQTYYVDLEKIISHLISIKVTGFTVEKPQQKRYEVKLLSGESMHFNPIGNPKNIKDYRFSFGNYAGWKTQFTKSELAEIKDGMFLKRIPGGTPLDDLGKDKSYYVWIEDCNYWKNPFIELVPVEDEE